VFSILWNEFKQILTEFIDLHPPINPVLDTSEEKTPPNASLVNPNRNAFLYAIAVSEGTQNIGDQGYNALFGGLTFSSYADHPRKEFWVPRYKINTSAAGRYQIEKGTWDDCAKTLGLKDFSPHSQDEAAILLITRRGALADVDAGRVGLAVGKCSSVWASLEGSKAGQPITPLGVFMAAYSRAGGKYEDWRVV
jgi:muramidase (phage lysozyme)